MILVDAGPLVSLIDRDEADHAACEAVLHRVTGPLVTSWPAFTEAMYLLGRIGWTAQRALWAMCERGALDVQGADPAFLARLAKLMAKYRDVPMDLADASLVALAEASEQHTVFTLDGDFTVYRLPGGKRFEVVP